MPTTAEARSTRASLFTQLTHAMDATPWRQVRREGGVRVSCGHPVFAPGGAPHGVEGFLIQAELEGVSIEAGLAYFRDACHFADTANKMTSASEVIEVFASEHDAFEAVVRTGFRLPWPLQDREFLHYVTTSRGPDAEGRDAALIAYATVDGPELPPPWPGALRCAMRPSGQRLTALTDGRVRFEHCMTYDLGGWIPATVQDRLFHSGHVRAYTEEWQQAMAVLAQEARA